MNGRWLTRIQEGVGIALESLGANRLRAGLTILGVMIGVAVVVTMAAFITGIRTSVLEAFEAAGPENLIVSRFDMTEVRLVSDGSGRPPWWNMPSITETEAMRLGRLEGVRRAIIDFDLGVSMSYRGTRVSNVQSSANSEGWPAYTVGTFVAGRDFLPGEVRQARSVVVISQPLAEELFGTLDPVGRRIRVSSGSAANQLFTVVGVFDLGEQIFAQAVEYLAIFPYTAATKRLRASDSFLGVLVVPEEGVAQEVIRDRVIGAMRSMRGLGPGEENNFAVIQSDQLVDLFNQLTAVFFLVMLALSSIGLLVGGVGVVGIMMISVTERTREIGIRKAVGATRREILWQFLVEASVLTLIGGALGLLLGGAVATAVAGLTPIPARIPLWSVVAALTMAALTGVVFGIAPALRASRMDPVAALGHE